MRRPSHSVRLRPRRGGLIVKAVQSARESTPEPERPKRKRPLRIGYVVQRLPHAPLLRRIAEHRPLLRYLREERHRVRKLPLEHRNRIVALDLVDVLPKEISRFRFLWSTAHARSEERRVGKECRSRWSPYP